MSCRNALSALARCRSPVAIVRHSAAGMICGHIERDQALRASFLSIHRKGDSHPVEQEMRGLTHLRDMFTWRSGYPVGKRPVMAANAAVSEVHLVIV